MTLLFVYLFSALSISFLCSITESSLLSTPFSSLKAKAKKWDKNAINLLKLKEDIDKPISWILTLNTIGHTVWAAWVWAQATLVFWEEWFWVISAVLTLLILIFTEIIPKTIWATYYNELSGFTYRTVKIMMFLTHPLVVASWYISKFFKKDENELTTSREEISALTNIWTEEWVFHQKENKIIQNLINLRSMTLEKIMTPRTVVVCVDEKMKLKEFLEKKENYHFTRIPVFKDRHDNVNWYIFRWDAFEKIAEDKFDLKTKDIKRDIIHMNKNTNIVTAWEQMLEKKEHIILVTDEYGWMSWIVTLEDIIESLLWFEILDEKDKIVDMQKYAKEKWEKEKNNK